MDSILYDKDEEDNQIESATDLLESKILNEFLLIKQFGIGRLIGKYHCGHICCNKYKRLCCACERFRRSNYRVFLKIKMDREFGDHYAVYRKERTDEDYLELSLKDHSMNQSCKPCVAYFNGFGFKRDYELEIFYEFVILEYTKEKVLEGLRAIEYDGDCENFPFDELFYWLFDFADHLEYWILYEKHILRDFSLTNHTSKCGHSTCKREKCCICEGIRVNGLRRCLITDHKNLYSAEIFDIKSVQLVEIWSSKWCLQCKNLNTDHFRPIQVDIFFEFVKLGYTQKYVLDELRSIVHEDKYTFPVEELLEIINTSDFTAINRAIILAEINIFESVKRIRLDREILFQQFSNLNIRQDEQILKSKVSRIASSYRKMLKKIPKLNTGEQFNLNTQQKRMKKQLRYKFSKNFKDNIDNEESHPQPTRSIPIICSNCSNNYLISTMLIPCGHLICNSCSHTKTCTICSTPISETISMTSKPI